MSLWYKPIDQIDIGDVEAFCHAKNREGPRLDYKADIPKHLPNLLSAFANTLGGVFLLGIDADQKTNEPNWPPKGMPAAKGIEERIVSICRDNIYPPVRPEISRVLDNPHNPGTVVVVVRVHESPEAPHAVDGGRKVYDRTASQNEPIQLAHIDRIQHLLDRRAKIEAEREDAISRIRYRAERRLPHKPEIPRRWISLIPLYPWRELCSPAACWGRRNQVRYSLHYSRPTAQSVPEGLFITDQTQKTSTSANMACTGVFALAAKGHVFAMEAAQETRSYAEVDEFLRREGYHNQKSEYRWIVLSDSREFFEQVVETADEFYKQPSVEKFGHVSVSVGFTGVFDVRMAGDGSANGLPFPDDEFRADLVVPLDAFLKNSAEATAPLLERVQFGFDVGKSDSPGIRR